MRITICIALLVTTFLFAGCTSVPFTSVRTIDDRPTLAIKGAPDTSILYVDGLSMGLANQYNGVPNILAVEPGTHIVRVMQYDKVIYEQRVFVEGSLKTIIVK